jgi:Domain of unknown function (DUF5122) beta-propeller
VTGPMPNTVVILPNHYVRLLFLSLFLTYAFISGCSSSDDNNPASGSTPPPGGGNQSGGPFNQGRGFNDIVYSIAMVPDGSRDVFVGGVFTDYNGTPANHLIRLHPDGTVAQTFGTGFDRSVFVIAPARDGSGDLYALGDFTLFNGQTVSPIARLNPDGSLDGGFRPIFPSGFVPTKITPADDGSGDLYVVSVGPSPGLPGPGIDPTGPHQISRLNADGTSDPTFVVGTFAAGSVITNLVPAPGTGKVYVGGSLISYNGQQISSLVRLNPDGTIDSSFMTGSGIIFISGNIAAVEALASARDGTQDIYAGGRISIYNETPVPLGTIRIHGNGLLDSTFVPAVTMITYAIAPAEDGTGDLLVFGVGTTSVRFLRLDHTGAVVPTFQEPNLAFFTIFSIVPVLDGTRDLYIGGEGTLYNGAAVNHFARIHADGTLASIVN